MSTDPLFQRRWEDGIDHHPKALELMAHMQKVDLEEGLPFDLSTGGDGDNGETLLYLMDSYFEARGDVAVTLSPADTGRALVIMGKHELLRLRVAAARKLIEKFDTKSKASPEEPRAEEFWDLINTIDKTLGVP
jgi:hypothetical protein